MIILKWFFLVLLALFFLHSVVLRLIRHLINFPAPDYPFRSTEKKWAAVAGFILKEEYGNWFTYQLNFGKPE